MHHLLINGLDICGYNRYITISPYGGTYIIYYLCIRNQNSLIIGTREYFEKVMQELQPKS